VIAQVLDQPAPASAGPLRLVERPDPEPAPGEVVVAVEACAVCRTDLQLAEGDLVARTLPIVPGHQVVGTVVAAGPHAEGVDVEPASLLGARVGIAWIAGTCGSCRFCRRGRENLCEHATFTGWDRDGGYATAVTARADFVHLLPDGFDAVASAPLLCGGAIGLRALRVAGVDEASAAGMQVGLYGFGASATVAIQVARHWGAEVHVATRSVAEQERARALGAVWAGSYQERPPVPLDAAVTFAPAGDVVIQALAALDRGAAVAINAIHLDRIPAFSYDALWWERSLRSVANVTRADVRDLLALAVAVPITTQVESLPLAAGGDALARLAAGDVSGAAVLTMDGVPGA
jgi:propanol-preferring alcohol dehydrogenase